MTSVEISVGIALVGCFVGLAGWLAGRDKRIASDAEWKGSVNAKLDVIMGIRSDVADLACKVNDHGERLKALESSSAQEHKRLDGRIDEIRKDEKA